MAWSRAAVSRIIQLVKENDALLADRKTRKKDIWSRIAATLVAEQLVEVSDKVCNIDGFIGPGPVFVCECHTATLSWS